MVDLITKNHLNYPQGLI